jgi:hypothetical protein
VSHFCWPTAHESRQIRLFNTQPKFESESEMNAHQELDVGCAYPVVAAVLPISARGNLIWNAMDYHRSQAPTSSPSDSKIAGLLLLVFMYINSYGISTRYPGCIQFHRLHRNRLWFVRYHSFPVLDLLIFSQRYTSSIFPKSNLSIGRHHHMQFSRWKDSND